MFCRASTRQTFSSGGGASGSRLLDLLAGVGIGERARIPRQVDRLAGDLVARVGKPAAGHDRVDSARISGCSESVNVPLGNCIGARNCSIRGDLIVIGGKQRRSEHVDLGIGRQQPVGEKVVIELRCANGPLIALARELVLVLAKNHVAFEVDLHRLPGVVDHNLAVGALMGSPFAGLARAR